MALAPEVDYRVVAPHFVARITINSDSGVVVDAAPILRWAMGKPWPKVERYMTSKRWEYAPLYGDNARDWLIEA